MYDALGRKGTMYNPTRCSPPTTNCGEPTWGFTTYSYDALNRVTSVTNPDSSTVQTAYTGRATAVTDEGNGRKAHSEYRNPMLSEDSFQCARLAALRSVSAHRMFLRHAGKTSQQPDLHPTNMMPSGTSSRFPRRTESSNIRLRFFVASY